MSRINTNVQSLIAQRVLGQNTSGLNQSLERLSTGFRINRGKDDPAGLIASENLRSEIKATNAAITNAERADQVLNIAEGGLQEVSGLLVELQGLLTSTASEAGLSQAEKEANQVQIDSILQTIDRIASQTNFQGTALLNGNFDFTTSAVSDSLSDFAINGAKFEGDSLTVNVNVTTSAQQGSLSVDLGGATLSLGGSGAQQSAFTIEISGNLGSRELSFSSGTTNQQIVDTINTFTSVTGVEAQTSSSGFSINSENFGSDAFASLRVVNAGNAQGSGIDRIDEDGNTVTTTFANADNGVRDSGQDIVATINGVRAVSNNRTVSIDTDVLNVSLDLTETAATTLASFDALQVTGGGANFQLGAKVNIGSQVSLGIQDVAARKIGQVEDSDTAGEFFFLDDIGGSKTLNVVDGDIETAQKVVTQAISDISELRGRLGAFQSNTIQATTRSLNIAVENTAAAESVIRDADFAVETAALTRNQILQQASINTLTLANQQPQNALALLG